MITLIFFEVGATSTPIIVNGSPTLCEEVINLKGQISEAERYLDNSEKLGVTSRQLREQLGLSQVRIEKLLQIDGAVEGYKLKVKAHEIEKDSL